MYENFRCLTSISGMFSFNYCGRSCRMSTFQLFGYSTFDCLQLVLFSSSKIENMHWTFYYLMVYYTICCHDAHNSYLFWEMYCEIFVWICRFWKHTIYRHVSIPVLTLSIIRDFKSLFTAFHKLKAYQNRAIRKIPFISCMSLFSIKIVGLLALSV